MRLNITPELFCRHLDQNVSGYGPGVLIRSVFPLRDECEFGRAKAESLLVQLTVVVMNSLRAVLLASADFLVNSRRQRLSVVEALI